MSDFLNMLQRYKKKRNHTNKSCVFFIKSDIYQIPREALIAGTRASAAAVAAS